MNRFLAMLVPFTSVIFVLQAPAGVQEDAAPKNAKVVRQVAMVYKPFTPMTERCGYVLDNKLRTEAPANGVIASAMKWEYLWKRWHGDKELPSVDFKKDVLFVFTSHGPNIPCLRLYLTGRSLRGSVAHTLKGGQGFGYRIIKVERKDVTYFFGQAIE
jgi:hypothetical protein